MERIFDEIISQKETSHRIKYYEIVHTALSSATDSYLIAMTLPDHVIKLAGLFWFESPNEQDWRHSSSRIGVEQYFGLSEQHHFEYFPASALQTPMNPLLQFHPKKTIDFIISFTNKAVDCYSKSKFHNEGEEVEVFTNGKEPIKQYISNRLWNTYRGTQVSTCLLESIHMALEKWLLEYAKTASQEELERLCYYLIKNSKSASITAIVASLVLAYPSKLFNIAMILFQTKEFFIYDTSRLMLDQTAKSNYSFGYGLNYQHKIFKNERIKACDDPHRKSTLEHLVVKYQFFRNQEVSEQEAEERQKRLWELFDKYYEKLPDKAKETEADKTWRLFLARMDRRKMHPEVKSQDDGFLINFNPDIDPELKKFSEDSLQKHSTLMKYTALKLWSDYRFKREKDRYKQYQQYETNIPLVIAETKEIIEGLKNKTEEDFLLLNRSIPAYTCSVLIRDFFDKLNSEEKIFCKEVILEVASLPVLARGYYYQICDGTEPSITVLPNLMKHFPEDKDGIKALLLLLLLNSWGEILTFTINGFLCSLWEISFEDTQSIFLGYLSLKPKYDNLREEIRKENYRKNVYEDSDEQLAEMFAKRYEKELETIISNKIILDDLPDLESFELNYLTTAFELLPTKTSNESHIKIITTIFTVFSKKIFIDDDKIDIRLKYRFLNKFAYFILNSPMEEIDRYLKPFVENFNDSEDMADFFKEFVFMEDRLNQYEEFWFIWKAFYAKVVEICKKEGHHYYTKRIVYNYLLAGQYWREEAKEWHSLKDREKSFFKKITEDIGHYPPVLYSISKLLNEIGSNFSEDGIVWISNMLRKNKTLLSAELEVNTIWYLENLVKRYT